jgi:hypothetical protein
MEMFDILTKLQQLDVTVQETKELVGGQKKLDKDKDGDIDKHDFAQMRKQKNEDIENVLRHLQSIQETPMDDEDEFDSIEAGKQARDKMKLPPSKRSPLSLGDLERSQVHPSSQAGLASMKKRSIGEDDEQEATKESLEECGDMSPLSMPGAMAAQEQQSPDRYTLNIQRGDKNLNVTTDNPAELMMLMKLAGVAQGTQVSQEQMTQEAWENTPIHTNERDPKPYGDIRDWALKGSGRGKPGSALNRPAGQGDNPLSEQQMIKEYKQFKSEK